MIRFLLPPALALLLAIQPAAARPGSTDDAIRAVLGDPAPYRSAVAALQEAIRSQDAAGVAALARYPLRTDVGGRVRLVPTAAALIAQYGLLMTPEIAAAVLDQPWDDLFVNAQGVMLGNGQIWLAGICADPSCAVVEVKVVTIQSGP